MDCPSVFDFTITEVPFDVQVALKEAGKSINDIDYFFHQANKCITDQIGKKLSIPSKKYPILFINMEILHRYLCP